MKKLILGMLLCAAAIASAPSLADDTAGADDGDLVQLAAHVPHAEVHRPSDDVVELVGGVADARHGAVGGEHLRLAPRH